MQSVYLYKNKYFKNRDIPKDNWKQIIIFLHSVKYLLPANGITINFCRTIKK